MRILTVHANYALRGGEDEVCEIERDLLREHGHTVTEYIRNNASIQGGGRVLSAGVHTVWSRQDYTQIRQAIRSAKAELVAVHNFFPLISPAVYYAAHAEGVPVVQTLHNYRLICPAATLLRDGELCEDCVGRAVPLPAVRHGCYRGSKVLTAGVAAMTSVHRLLGTWDRRVTRYIALTEFMRDRYIAGGFPADKIVVKPNFTHDNGVGPGGANTFVYAGRLSPEKGVATLLHAWALAKTSCELRILGTGPEEMNLRAQAARLQNVTFLGQQPKSRVLEEMGQAVAVVVPSIWHEAFGLTIVEALAKGTPVLATNIGGIGSIVTPGRSGYLFARKDAAGLAALLENVAGLRAMRTSARQDYEARYTPERNYAMLSQIYAEAAKALGPSDSL